MKFKKLKKMISSTKFKNSIFHWNCQDYVFEILNKFAEECIVNKNEKEYKNAKNELKNNYGAMIWCNNSGSSNLWNAFQQRLYCHPFVSSRRQAASNPLLKPRVILFDIKWFWVFYNGVWSAVDTSSCFMVADLVMKVQQLNTRVLRKLKKSFENNSFINLSSILPQFYSKRLKFF